MITVRVDDAPVQAMLRRLAQSVSNMQPAMAEIGIALRDNIQLGFKDSTGPYGKWQQLKRARRLNRKAGDTGKPLLDTGALRNTITYQADANSVIVGAGSTAVKYAPIHQFGGKAGRGRKAIIPARPFMPIRNGKADLPASWQADIIGILQRRITEVTK